MALARQRAMFGDTMVLVKAMHEDLQNTIHRMKTNLASPSWPQGSSYKQKIEQFARNGRVFPLIILVTTLVEPGLRKVMVDNDNDVNPASFAAS